MITGTKYLAWFCLFIGAVLTVVGALSFVVDIPGMVMNGVAVKTINQRIVFSVGSSGVAAVAGIAILLLKPKILKMNETIAKGADWLERLPIANTRVQAYVLSTIIGLSLLLPLIVGRASISEHLQAIPMVPFAFAGGFAMSFVVLGVQVINPFCPERVLRFAALVVMSLSLWGSIADLPMLLIRSPADKGAFLLPSASIGMAAGAFFVVKRWTRFTPEQFTENA